ncbi:Disulfide bond formation protein C [Peribacillus sp. Bi96]|uniref:disulfide oxidoreductase n=1 Tax=Peribacillus sp. NPDC060253 TaxID=3347084 RepID=UPI001D3EE7C1|nr:Disulfide bond formation protein C [Peribacillus sp. Bi96]
MGKRNHEQDYTQWGKLIICGLGCSIIAMFGSLYFSEIKQNEPFALCWYQRIIIYPFTIILGIAIIRKDHWICLYTMIVTAIGAFIPTYRYFVQKVSFFPDHTLACGRVPCIGQYIDVFGFITIPF